MVLRALATCAALTSCVLVDAATQAGQTGAAPAVDVTRLGPQVGDKVPDFTLPDQHGQTRTLASLMGSKGLVLVFSRSADW